MGLCLLACWHKAMEQLNATLGRGAGEWRGGGGGYGKSAEQALAVVPAGDLEAQLASLTAELKGKNREMAAAKVDLAARQGLLRSAAGRL